MTKSVDIGRGCRSNHRTDHIIHIDIIARLASIAVDDQRPAAEGLLANNAAQRADVRRQVLTRSIGVEDSQADRFDAPQARRSCGRNIPPRVWKPHRASAGSG